jgi:hypothetical protein
MANTVVTGSADVFTSGSTTMDEVFAFLDTEPVGTVKESILSQAQFQARAGDGWVLANGASLSTSAYPELFAAIGYTYGGSGGSFNIPNMQNKYNRMSGASAVGTFQGQSTKKNGLSVSGGSFYLAGGTQFGGVSFLAACHAHTNNRYYFPLTLTQDAYNFRAGSPNTFFPGYCQLRFRTSLSCNSSAYGCSTSKKGIAVCGTLNCAQGTSSATISYTSPSLSSSTETRPDTIVLNWFMRVR